MDNHLSLGLVAFKYLVEMPCRQLEYQKLKGILLDFTQL